MSTVRSGNRKTETHENQGGIEVLVILPQAVGVIFLRLSFLHGEEVKVVVFALDWLEILPQCLLDAIWGQPTGTRTNAIDKTHH
jgi:hypothetical protein